MNRSRPILLLALLAGLRTMAQEHLLFERPAFNDALPGSEVRALLEDDNGFMWVGTNAGLVRLEGTRMRTYLYDSKDSTSLSNDQVNDLIQDEGGTIWVATAGGFCRYLPALDAFQRYRIEAPPGAVHQANRVSDIVAEHDRRLWLCAGSGLYMLDRMTGTLGRVAKSTAPGQGLPNDTVDQRSLHWDRAHHGLWIATTAGLCFFDAGTGKFHDARNPVPGWSCFQRVAAQKPTPDGQGGLWWYDASNYRLYHSDLRGGEAREEGAMSGAHDPYTVRRMYLDRDGRLWLCSWTYHLDVRGTDGRWTRVRTGDEPWSLGDVRCETILQRANGELWLGLAEGVRILDPSFAHLRVLTFPRLVTAVLPLGTDTLLVSTRGAGVQVTTRDSAVRACAMPDIPGIPYMQGHQRTVTDVRPSRSGFWVATGAGPLRMDHGCTRMWKDATFAAQAPDVYANACTFIQEDRSGRTWCGTWSKGLFRSDHERVAHWTASDRATRLPIDMTLCGLQDRRGDMWIGLNDGGGLVRFQGGALPARAMLLNTAAAADLGNGVVRCLAEAPDGLIWFGTHEGGVGHIDPATGQVTMYTRRDGLPGSRVLGIHFDRDGSPWVVTNLGVAHRPQGHGAFVQWPLPFGLDPELLSGAIGPGFDGTVAIGAGQHLLLVDGGALRTAIAPEARITEVRTADSTYHAPSTGQVVPLSYASHALGLLLGAVGNTGPAPHFGYRDASADTTWTDLGTAARLDLNALPAGEHRIEVRASNDGVNWGPPTAHLVVQVSPPFWRTWWFGLATVGIVALMVLLLFRNYLQDRLRAQRQQHEREKAVLAERMRIAGDMHDDLGAGLSALKLRSEMALRVEKDPGRRELLGALADTAGELIGNMRQIIWTMNADQSGLEDLVVYCTNHARRYAGENGLVAHIEADGPWPAVQLTTEQKRNVFLVVKEALHNVVKHAQAHQVSIRFEAGKELQVRLHDDGIGLPMAAGQGVGNGLRNMERRITTLGGTFHIANDHGTTLRFSLPLPAPNQGSIARPEHPERPSTTGHART